MIICLIGEAFRGIAAGRHALMFTDDWGLGICTYMSDTDMSQLWQYQYSNLYQGAALLSRTDAAVWTSLISLFARLEQDVFY